MKLLIIGGGAVSESFHIPSTIKVLGVENIFLAEPNELQLSKVVEKFGLLNYATDYKSLLNKVDTVIIATPPHIHNAILSECIKSKLHVLCEKPLSPNSDESKKVLNEDKDGLVLGMCHTYRLFSNRLKVRQMIREGYFGNNLTIQIEEGFPAGWPTVSGYCFRKDMVPGGVLFDAGIHSLDFILWCMGEPDSIEYTDDEMGGLESNASIKLSFENGSAEFRISRTCELSNKIIVSGNGKSVELDVYEMNYLTEKGVKTVANEDRVLDWTNIAEVQTQNFIDAINKENEISCTASDGIKVVELLEKCYKSKTKTEKEPKPISNLKSKKVLVTGGTGFIGSLLVERLYIHEQADVRVMVHNWPKAAYVSRFDVELVKAEITNYDDVEKAVAGCDFVFHCVGVGGSADYAMTINALGAEHVVKACAKHQVKRVVYLSSVVVHGDKITDGMSADAPFVSYGDAYADAKIEAEKRFWKLTKEANLEASVIRPTYVWGPMSEWFTVDIIKQMKQNRFFWVDYGKGSCNAVFVENVIDLSILCAEHPNAVGEAFLAADKEQMNWRTFYGYYAKMLNMEADRFLSIPLKDGVKRRFLKLCKNKLNYSIALLWDKVLATENTKPLYSKWVLRAPRKLLKVILKQIVKRLPEKSASDMAIYNYQGFIDVSKNKDLLNYETWFSVEDGMKITNAWLKDQNFIN